jgi:hypothetical protein
MTRPRSSPSCGITNSFKADSLSTFLLPKSKNLD